MLVQIIPNKRFNIIRSSWNKHHGFSACSRLLLEPSSPKATWRKLLRAGLAHCVGGKRLREFREPQGRVLISDLRWGSNISLLIYVSYYRWGSRRASLANGPAYLPSSACYHSASPQHPCSATTGLWAHRRCPSPCAGKVYQPSALTCRCPWMGAAAMHLPRRWCTTAGRQGMTGSPSMPSGAACGYPVRRSWKNQVAASPPATWFLVPRPCRGKCVALAHTGQARP